MRCHCREKEGGREEECSLSVELLSRGVGGVQPTRRAPDARRRRVALGDEATAVRLPAEGVQPLQGRPTVRSSGEGELLPRQPREEEEGDRGVELGRRRRSEGGEELERRAAE